MKIDLNAAVAKHQSGQLDEAEKAYRYLLTKNPRNLDLNRNLGILLFQKGDIGGSLDVFKKNISNKIFLKSMYEAYAQVLVKSQRFSQLMPLYESILNLPEKDECLPKLLSIMKNAVVSFFNDGDHSTATKLIDTCSGAFEADAEVANIAGVCGLHLNRYDYALASFSQAIERDPNNDELCVNKSIVLEKLGRSEEAVQSLLKAIAINANNDNALLNLSVIWVRDGNYPAFVELIKTKDDPMSCNDDILYNFSYCLTACGKTVEAQEILYAILERNPQYVNAHILLGDCLQTSDMNKAISLYEVGVKTMPSSELYIKLYDITKLANLKTKEDYYLSILEAEFPSLSEVKIRKSQKMLEGGRIDEAKKILSTISLNDPFALTAANILGQLAFAVGDFSSASSHFERSLDIDPRNLESLNNLAAAKLSLGDPSAAVRYLEQSLDINSTFFEAINNLGIANNSLGDFPAAIKSYAQVLGKTPNVWNNLYFPLRTQLLAGETSLADIEDLLKDVKSEQPLSYFTLMHRLKKGLREGAQSHVDLVEHVRESKDYILGNAVPDNNEGSLVGALKGEPIALLHFGRSGSGFLHSLIDGHPEISTLPSIFLSEFFDLETWRDLKKDGISELAGRFVDHYEVLFDSRSKKPIATKSGQKLYDFGEKEGLNNLGENKNSYISLDKKKFITILQSLIDKEPYLSQARLFELVHEAVDRLASRSSDGKKIFYHIHNPDTLAYAHYISCFPKGKVLVIVRDPIQSCESWASKSGDDYLKTCQRIIQMLHDIDDPVYGMVDSAAIKLEDIKKSPQASLQELCGWMGISYSESLSKMTVMGKRWWGDPTSPDYRVDGMEPFGTTSIMRETTDFFNKQDREILETLFFPFSSAFEYTTKSEAEFINDLKLLPTKIDNLFEFERRFLDARPFDENELRQMGYFRYLRAEMLNKWKVLSEYGTYPNLIPWIKNVVK